MKKVLIPAAILTSVFMMTSCDNRKNPLLEEWNTPFGIPPFEEVETGDYKPAILAAIEEHNREIDAIINNPDAPDFENTIVALDNSGSLFNRVYAVFGSETSINSTPELMAVETEMAPVVSAHFNDISLNEKLFDRVKAVYEKRDSLGLDPDQMRLLTETYKDYERSGATLPADKKEELKKINSRISELQLKFEQNVLKETADFTLVVENEADLAGLPQAAIDAAAQRAAEKGMDGWWVFGLDNASVMPFLQFDDNRALRTKLLDGYLNRGNNGNDNDNKAIIIEMVNLYNRKAKIMGCDNYAEFVLQDRMAKTPEAVFALLDQLWTPALKSAKRELADMYPIAKAQGVDGELTAADWRYYFEKAKAEKFDLSEDELKPISSSRMYVRVYSTWPTVFTALHSPSCTMYLSPIPKPRHSSAGMLTAPHSASYSWTCLPVPVSREAGHGAEDTVSSTTRTARGLSPSLLSAATLPAVPAMHPHCLVRTRQRHSSTSSVMLSSHSCRM